MYPIIFEFGPFDIFGIQLGPIAIYTYGLFVALGFLGAIYTAVKLGDREKIAEETVLDLCLWILIFSIAGARIFYILINLQYYIDNPIEVIQVYKGGLVFYGGFIGGLLTAVYYTKKHKISLWTLADILAPGIALGQGFGRIGCFFKGCCYGQETTLPWGITFPGNSLPAYIFGNEHFIHPTQIYSSIINFSIFGFLFYYFSKSKFKGEVFCLYVALYAVGRFIVESLRGDMERGFVGFLSTSQLISLVLLAAGTYMYFNLKKKQNT